MIENANPVRKIIHLCAVKCGVEPAEMYSSSRRAVTILPRQVACFVAVSKLGASSKHVGRVMNRDHSTVLHAVARIEQRLRNGCEKTQKLVSDVWEAYHKPLPPTVKINEVATIEKRVAPPVPTVDVCDEIKKLRARGLPVNRIAERVQADEFFVARMCGVQFWKGRHTNEVQT